MGGLVEGQGEDQVGPEGADDAHHVAERLVVPPLREGLLDAEREAELVGAREVLLDSVVAVDREELLGAHHPEGLAELGADRVLPAFAAGQGQKRGAVAEAAGESHQHPVVLVVGMGGHVEHARRHSEPPQGEAETVAALVDGDGRELGLRGRARSGG